MMDTTFPKVHIVRLFDQSSMVAPLYCPVDEIVPYALDACLSSGLSLARDGKHKEATARFKTMMTLIQRDPLDWFSITGDLQDIGFHVSVPLPCVFVDAVLPVDDTPNEVAP